MRNTTALLFALLAGCAQLPDVAPPKDQGDIDYPPLVPLNTLDVGTEDKEAQALETEQSVANRVAGLQARAARLRAVEFN